MSQMKFIAFFIGVFFLTSAQAKGIKAVYDLEVSDSESSISGEITAYYDNNKMRMEITFDKKPEHTIIHLLNSEKNRSYIVFPNVKKFSEYLPLKENFNIQSEDFKPSNEVKTIAGFSCEVFGRIDKQFVETVCVSEDLYKKYRTFMDLFKQVGQKQSYYKKDLKGFPLEYHATFEGKTQSKLTLTSLKAQRIASKKFRLPKGYSRSKEEVSGNNVKKLEKKIDHLQKESSKN